MTIATNVGLRSIARSQSISNPPGESRPVGAFSIACRSLPRA